MPKTNLWNQSVPRVELDQRSREARLRLERIEPRPLPYTVATRFRLRRFLMAVSREYGSLLNLIRRLPFIGRNIRTA
jgi:hypothetical protein